MEWAERNLPPLVVGPAWIVVGLAWLVCYCVGIAAWLVVPSRWTPQWVRELVRE
jgi:hypothetical protein